MEPVRNLQAQERQNMNYVAGLPAAFPLTPARPARADPRISKRCQRCEISKHVSEFALTPELTRSRDWLCKTCRDETDRKTCQECQERKPLREFGRSARRYDTKCSSCRVWLKDDGIVDDIAVQIAARGDRLVKLTLTEARLAAAIMRRRGVENPVIAERLGITDANVRAWDADGWLSVAAEPKRSLEKRETDLCYGVAA